MGKTLLYASAFLEVASYFFGGGGHRRLAENNFVAVTHDPARGVARVYNKSGGVYNCNVIVARVIRRDDNPVIASQGLGIERDGLHVFVVVVAHFVELREIGIVVFEICAALLQELH